MARSSPLAAYLWLERNTYAARRDQSSSPYTKGQPFTRKRTASLPLQMQILPVTFARAKEAAENHVKWITVQKYSESHLLFSFASWIMDEPWGGSDFQQLPTQSWTWISNFLKKTLFASFLSYSSISTASQTALCCVWLPLTVSG